MSHPTRPQWFIAWTGLALAPAAWAVHHQAGSDLNYADCEGWGSTTPIVIGLVALVAAIVSGLLSLRAWRSQTGEVEGSPLRFVAALGLMASGLFALTILVQIIAAALVPPCFR